MSRQKVLLAEDHELVGEGLRALLAQRYEVSGPVRDGRAVPDAVLREEPDILVLDLSMPGRNGLDLIPEVRRINPETAILIVTMHTEAVLARAALSQGALGYMPKDCGVDELYEAIEKVGAGLQYLSPRIAAAATPTSSMPTDRTWQRLTPRQREIMKAIALGQSSEEIAEGLGVSVHTVHFHRRNIRRMMGIDSDVGLFRAALIMQSGSEEE
ncbi:MAG: response regulator [Gemmatimonadales bacterium]